MTPLPEYLWHGTTLDRLQEILDMGLGGSYKLCLTSRRDIAVHFASLRSMDDHTPMVLIAIPSASLDQNLLAPDPALMIAPYGAQKNVVAGSLPDFNAEWDRCSSASWQASLESCFGIIFRGAIPVSPDMVDVSPASLPIEERRIRNREIEFSGIEPDDSRTPAEPVFVADPIDWIRQRA